MNSYKGDEYKTQLRTFRRTVETLDAKAKAKSMDGVVLAFNDMTGQCLKCHATMRDNKFEIRMELGDRVTSGHSSSDREP